MEVKKLCETCKYSWIRKEGVSTFTVCLLPEKYYMSIGSNTYECNRYEPKEEVKRKSSSKL